MESLANIENEKQITTKLYAYGVLVQRKFGEKRTGYVVRDKSVDKVVTIYKVSFIINIENIKEILYNTI